MMIVMETIHTVVCKLAPTPEQTSDIDATLKAFALACDVAADTARRIGSTNKVKVQQVVYRDIRKRFGLSANLAIRAIARACAALKIPEKMHSAFAPTSIDYDARIFSFVEWNWTFSLTLLSGRAKIVAVLGERQKSLLKGRKPTAAQLVKRRHGGYFLHVQLSDDAPEPIEATDHIGVDFGVAKIATTSDDPEGHCGKPVERVRRKHNLQRKRLQRKGTKGAKKKLRRLAGKEARFRRHENHCISKTIVKTAKDTGRGIALEDLEGIRGRITARGGDARNRLSGWSFHQLRSFISYKATDAGIPVVLVDPRNTSLTCSACRHCEKSNRKSQAEFLCKHCGFSANADWNAARNIRALAASKAPTELAIVEAKTGNRTEAQISRKATALQCG
jgi:IS605 OrfB family transposase